MRCAGARGRRADGEVNPMEHKGTKTLETERILLRPFREDDSEAMFRNWAGDPEVCRYLTWGPHESADVSRQICALWASQSDDPAFYQWAIVPKALGEPVGSISVVRSNDDIAEAEVGYCIGRRWWGQGFTPEALRAVVRYLITEVGMNRVSAKHDVNNPNSGRVMRKAGMTKEGVLRAAARNNQGVADMAVYSILAGEYRE